MCAALGGIKACDTFETIGSYGTIHGPKMAMSEQEDAGSGNSGERVAAQNPAGMAKRR